MRNQQLPGDVYTDGVDVGRTTQLVYYTRIHAAPRKYDTISVAGTSKHSGVFVVSDTADSIRTKDERVRVQRITCYTSFAVVSRAVRCILLYACIRVGGRRAFCFRPCATIILCTALCFRLYSLLYERVYRSRSTSGFFMLQGAR